MDKLGRYCRGTPYTVPARANMRARLLLKLKEAAVALGCCFITPYLMGMSYNLPTTVIHKKTIL